MVSLKLKSSDNHFKMSCNENSFTESLKIYVVQYNVIKKIEEKKVFMNIHCKYLIVLYNTNI